jgi:hypothetical protein
MKGKIFITVASLVFMNYTAFATPSIIYPLKQAHYQPVEWHATMQNGGFGIENKTHKTQFVQVAIKSGEIYVYTLDSSHKLGSCEQSLNASTGPYSIICELAPGDTMAADIDFARMSEATGTYQVKM